MDAGQRLKEHTRLPTIFTHVFFHKSRKLLFQLSPRRFRTQKDICDKVKGVPAFQVIEAIKGVQQGIRNDKVKVKVGVRRDIFHDSGNHKIKYRRLAGGRNKSIAALNGDHFAHSIPAPEILLRHLFSQNHGIRFFQCSFRVAFKKGKGECGKE